MKIKTPNYQRHRFPSEIINHAVLLYRYGQKTQPASQQVIFKLHNSLLIP